MRRVFVLVALLGLLALGMPARVLAAWCYPWDGECECAAKRYCGTQTRCVEWGPEEECTKTSSWDIWCKDGKKRPCVKRGPLKGKDLDLCLAGYTTRCLRGSK